MGTLFQPERSAFAGVVHPLIKAFLQAVVYCIVQGQSFHPMLE
jgi:hypothetical protein